MQLPNQVNANEVNANEGASAAAAAGQEVRSPETEGLTENDQSMLQEEKMRPPPRPLESGEEKLWEIFCDIDEDDGGTLDKEEVAFHTMTVSSLASLDRFLPRLRATFLCRSKQGKLEWRRQNTFEEIASQARLFVWSLSLHTKLCAVGAAFLWCRYPERMQRVIDLRVLQANVFWLCESKGKEAGGEER